MIAPIFLVIESAPDLLGQAANSQPKSLMPYVIEPKIWNLRNDLLILT